MCDEIPQRLADQGSRREVGAGWLKVGKAWPIQFQDSRSSSLSVGMLVGSGRVESYVLDVASMHASALAFHRLVGCEYTSLASRRSASRPHVRVRGPPRATTSRPAEKDEPGQKRKEGSWGMAALDLSLHARLQACDRVGAWLDLQREGGRESWGGKQRIF